MNHEQQKNYAKRESNALAMKEIIFKADKDLDSTNRGYNIDDSKLENNILEGVIVTQEDVILSTTSTSMHNDDSEMMPISDAIDHYSYHSSPALLKQIRKKSLVKKTFASTNLLKLLVEAASHTEKQLDTISFSEDHSSSSMINDNHQSKEEIDDDIGPQLIFDEESLLLPLKYNSIDITSNPNSNATSNAQQLYVLKLFAAYQYLKIVTESFGLPIIGIPAKRIPSPNLTRTDSFIDNRYSRDGKVKGINL